MVALIRHSGKHVMVLVTLADGSVLDTTDGHPIWDATTDMFTDAGHLHVGDKIETTGGALLTISRPTAANSGDHTKSSFRTAAGSVRTCPRRRRT